jgi:hypothetical protein
MTKTPLFWTLAPSFHFHFIKLAPTSLEIPLKRLRLLIQIVARKVIEKLGNVVLIAQGLN